MSITAIVFIGTLVAIAAGFVLGWTIGRRLQKFDNANEVEQQKFYRINAQKDFGEIGALATQVVDLANRIASRAGRARDTIEPNMADMGRASGSALEPGVTFEAKQ